MPLPDRVFMQLTEAEVGEGGVWLDVDQVIAVHETKTVTLVYLVGMELPVPVTETAGQVMDRMLDATKTAMAQR
jgi:RIO-like serine/threonine protein kinase